jgi:hypothetical protein
VLSFGDCTNDTAQNDQDHGEGQKRNKRQQWIHPDSLLFAKDRIHSLFVGSFQLPLEMFNRGKIPKTEEYGMKSTHLSTACQSTLLGSLQKNGLKIPSISTSAQAAWLKFTG